MKKRVFSAKAKAEVVLEVLKGEKELNVIASEKEIVPNQIRKWKTEFIENAELVFDNKRDKEYKQSIRNRTFRSLLKDIIFTHIC